MQKRYQVFVSSTFLDLKEERIEVMQLLLKNNFIPAGMELFPASNENQFSYIKKTIDQSDYYVLIIAGRYGSCDESGISYTEKEYDYAVENNIPVIVFIHDDVGKLPREKTELETNKMTKLVKFIDKVSSNRLIQKWINSSDLQLKLNSSLLYNITNSSAIGWVRGDSVSSSQQVEEINSLLKENKKLKEQLSVKNESINLEILSAKYTILVNNNIKLNKIELTLFDIFKNITLNYIEEIIEQDVIKDLFDYIKTINPDILLSQINFDVVIRDLRNKFRALDIIDMCYKSNDLGTVWSLSGKGEELVKAIYLTY